MSLTPGTRLGPFEIAALIGMGGMGEVYRATDTNLKRHVAIKVLPEAIAAHADRLVRFQREAEVLASLNHPNIAIVHGLEKGDGVTGLVMELVEGLTLADRIGQGPVPIDEALPIAKQIAEALGAAQEHGIVHRDLKPANIKVRADGTVKVLDFGLAKTLDPDPDPSQMSQSPTITSPAVTRAGVILGTAAYMAPEQAMGKAADARSDIWGFGLVFYEMLTGRRGFVGETTVEVLSNVLKAEPDWTVLPAATPPAVTSLVRRCLQKDPTRRLRDITDARFQIEEAIHERMDKLRPSEPARAGHSYARPLAMAAAVAAIAAASATATWWLVAVSRAAQPETRLEITTPPTTDPSSLAISPDGRQVVFVGGLGNRSLLWVRSLAGGAARPLEGTENARFPFWSPDSRSVGFSADSQLKRIDVEQGSVQVVAAPAYGGGAWSRDGTIVFDAGLGFQLFRVSADGGKPTALTRRMSEINDPSFPQFLQDHRHFLFYGAGPAPGIYVASLDAPEAPRRILEAEAATYLESGHLFFIRQGTLYAQVFDEARLALTGAPTRVADHVLVSQQEGAAALSASSGGLIVYRAGQSRVASQFRWFDRAGNLLDTVVGSESVSFNSSLSPDGSHLAVTRRTGESDLWLLDLGRGRAVASRFTTDPAVDVIPVWSPDAMRIAFTSNRNGTFDLYVKATANTESERLLVMTDKNDTPSDWSPDGEFILYTHDDRDIWAFPINGDRLSNLPVAKPADPQRGVPVAATASVEANGQFSPDGHWVAYQSDEAGQLDIYVQLFSGPGPKTRISSNGGVQVRWRRDGRELYYVSPDSRLFAVPIQLDAVRGIVKVGDAMPLFAPALAGPTFQPGSRQFMVSQDGQRFLVDTLEEVTLPITVIQNWTPSR